MKTEYEEILDKRSKGEKPLLWGQITKDIEYHNLSIPERQVQFMAEIYEILDSHWGHSGYIISASELINEYVAKICAKTHIQTEDCPKNN